MPVISKGRLVLVGAVVAASTGFGGVTIAPGADLVTKARPPAPVAARSWTGCYAGLQVGGGSSHSAWRYNGANAYNSLDPAGPVLSPEQTFNDFKPVVGGQVGCNLSYAGPWVLGMEAGFLATPMDRSLSTGIDPILGNGTFTGNVRTEISGIASLTGRIGYSVLPDWLIYARGGYAAAHIELRGNISPAGLEQFTFSDANWHHGWAAGGGLEYRLFQNVTLGAEYVYYSFADRNYFGAQPTLPDANQVRIRTGADVHTVMARINFYDPGSAAANVNPIPRIGAPNGTFSSFVDNSVKYSSFTGTRGANTFAPDRGKGDQVFSPFLVGIDYVEPNVVKVESRVKGGYVHTAQRTSGQTATYQGPIDTQTSLNVELLNFDTIRPQFGLATNVPTGTSYLPNNQRFTRIDPDLVEVGSYGAGFNVNPTAGFVMGLNETTAISVSAGYAWNGKFVREAVDLNTPFGPGAFDLKQYINPGDVFTGNANLVTQFAGVALVGSFIYMSESRVVTNGIASGRTGARYTTNVNATREFDDRWAITTNTTWSFAEKNDIAFGGILIPEPKNSNSNLVIGSFEPSYRLTEMLRLAVNYSFLWRDANFYDQIENQFIPAKTKHTAGASVRYTVSPMASFELRGSHSWINQEDSAILPVTLTPPTSAAVPPELTYRAWMISVASTIRF